MRNIFSEFLKDKVSGQCQSVSGSEKAWSFKPLGDPVSSESKITSEYCFVGLLFVFYLPFNIDRQSWLSDEAKDERSPFKQLENLEST